MRHVYLILLCFLPCLLYCQINKINFSKEQAILYPQSTGTGIHTAYLNNPNKSYRMSEKGETSHLGIAVGSSLISYGVLAQVAPAFRDVDVVVQNWTRKRIQRTYSIDDYIQYAPISGVFLLDIIGVPARHNVAERTFVVISSGLICTSISHGTKFLLNTRRPDSRARNSFPSAHTSLAFWGAHILYKEYKDVSPWIGIAGYVIASATAIFRVVNDRHWFSDIVGGAGVGILSVELGYLLLKPGKRVFHF